MHTMYLSIYLLVNLYGWSDDWSLGKNKKNKKNKKLFQAEFNNMYEHKEEAVIEQFKMILNEKIFYIYKWFCIFEDRKFYEAPVASVCT
jgi:hypothetical protein